MSTHSLSPVLPLEVIYHAIDLLHGDKYALRNCSLTCHALSRCARAHLFRDTSVSGFAIQRFARLIQSDPHIGKLIQCLEMRDIELWTSPEELPQVSLLANLRSLTLHQAAFEFLDTVFQILENVPALDHLACIGMIAGIFSDPLEAYEGADDQLSITGTSASPAPRLQPRCPKLRSIVAKHGHVDQDIFAQRFLEMDVPSHLEILDISFGATDQHMHWVPVIRAARETLTHLRMSMSEESVPYTLRATQQFNDPYSFVGDALAGCASLTSLSLKHCPEPGDKDVKPFHFLTSLCEFFERPVVPLPALGQLTLDMVDRDGDMISAEPHVCTRLARGLLSRDRYQFFRALVIHVRSQMFSRHTRTWLCRGGLVGESKRALLDRWRAAFSSFEESPGVSLEVDLTL